MKNPLAIIYLVDGARPDVMRELLDNGDLPNLRREILGAGTFRTASSCFPSTTGPAYLPFLAGCFPGTMNIPGIRWLDKAEFHGKRWGRNSFRSYMGYEAPWFNHDLPKEHPTLYELFQRPFNIYSLITRGLPKGHNLTSSTKLPLYFYAHMTDRWRPVDRGAHRHLMRALDMNPDFIFAVFPGVDSYSHLKHPWHDDTISAYRFVDFSIGQVVEKLKRSGRWDETLVIITSDHGLTATYKHFDLALFLQQRGIKTLYYPIVWKVKPKASVMISGNSAGLVYYLNGKNAAPLMGEQIKVALGSTWDELLVREEIDFIAYRNSRNVYEIISARGHAKIFRQPEGLSYLPGNGDPFGLGKIEQPLDRQQALETTFASDYPDALVQIEQFFSCSRSGDFVVSARNGYDLREAFEWPEHHASHGSLHREHMIVPLLYNQTGWDPRPARTTDLFNTILKWAGKTTLENTDGQSLC